MRGNTFEMREALTTVERSRRYRAKKPPVQIAVLDMETDPFDNVNQTPVHPFLAILYAPEFEPIKIWDENWHRLMAQVRDCIAALPGRYIIYAHNGGRFDYLLLLRELRGQVLFKGRSLMSARIGAHEIRDSFHIIPESLKNANRKTEIDYSWFIKSRRNSHRDAIIAYCLDDCKSLYELVSRFKDRFGSPISIGQAAMREIRKHYQFERLSPKADEYFRQWFFGGRVECLKTGVIFDNYNLFDVNSMYPFVMATYEHPITKEFAVKDHITDKTLFLTIRCKNNGALVGRAPDGSLTTQIRDGIFNTTIWEYRVAMQHGLIADVEIVRTIEFQSYTNFEKFVLPLYADRLEAKRLIDIAERSGDLATVQSQSTNSLFFKLLLNNGYGKFAQNPRNYKTHFITDPQEKPPIEFDSGGWPISWGDLPSVETDGYWVWCRPSDDHRFNNVATAASITGAARSVLLHALATCREPLYCDTDSIICRELGNLSIDKFQLGSWKAEARLDAYIGNGKKLYAYHTPDKSPPKDYVVKAKGVNGVTWQDMLDIAAGKTIPKYMTGPTIGKDGGQQYMKRDLRRTFAGSILLPN